MRFVKVTLLGALASMAAINGGTSAQEVTDWSGFYAGVFAGYGIDTATATSSSSAPITIEQNPGQFYTAGQDSSQTRFESFIGGAQAGYNYQFQSFVLGLEGTAGVGGLTKTNEDSSFLNIVDGADFSNNSISSRTDFSIDWLTTFSAKVGVDLDGWLLYGKAGVAIADIASRSSSSYVVESSGVGGILGPIADGTYSSSSAYSGIRGGPSVGIGLEKMLNENISIGAEYSYVNLGNVDVPSAGLLGGLLGSGDPQTFSANLHTVKASLSYHF